MRQRWLAAALLMFLLSGCGTVGEDPLGTEEPQQTEQTEQTEPVHASSKTGDLLVERSGALTAVQTEQSNRPLTQEEVLSAYDRAVTAYTWFDLTPLSSTGEPQTVDRRVYRKVERPGLSRMEELRAYLRTVFSEELTQRLLETGGETPLYRDIDGELWVAVNGGRRRDPNKGAVELRVAQESDTAYAVNVTVELLEDDRSTVTGVECYAFPYEWEGDRWSFTAFQLVY